MIESYAAVTRLTPHPTQLPTIHVTTDATAYDPMIQFQLARVSCVVLFIYRAATLPVFLLLAD